MLCGMCRRRYAKPGETGRRRATAQLLLSNRLGLIRHHRLGLIHPGNGPPDPPRKDATTHALRREERGREGDRGAEGEMGQKEKAN